METKAPLLSGAAGSEMHTHDLLALWNDWLVGGLCVCMCVYACGLWLAFFMKVLCVLRMQEKNACVAF